MRRMNSSSSRRGFSILEMLISMSVLMMLMGALVQTLGSLRSLATVSGARTTLQAMGDRALVRVVDELRSSGAVVSGTRSYPFVFDGGDAGEVFTIHTHTPAEGTAVAGDPDFGPDREIVFLVPRDQDGDRRPDLDADGELVWALEERSFVVNTHADGVNYLELRQDGVEPRVIGTHVERVVFDTAESSAFQIPLNSVRVRLYFKRQDSQGNTIRYQTEAVVVALRNT
jgi:hypothetical protein